MEKSAVEQPGPSGLSEQNPGLWRVGVRVPPFWPEEPAVWFAQIEGQFTISNITSDMTKFYHVVGQLEPQYAVEVKDVILNPPASGRYEKLKTELIKRLSASQERKLQQLLTHEELGDRKPSQFMRHLQNLAGPTVPEHLIRQIWSNRLPTHIQTIIASQSGSTLETVAELADKINDISSPTQQAASTSACEAPGTVSALEMMAKRVDELARQVQNLSTRNSRSSTKNRNFRSRSTSRNRSRSRERPDDHPHCWYHFIYGSKAINCRQPCTFKSAGNANGGH